MRYMGKLVNRYVPGGELCAKNEAKRGSSVNRYGRVAFLWGPGLLEGAKVEAKRGCWVNRYVPRGEMCAKNEAKRGSWVNRKWYVITTQTKCHNLKFSMVLSNRF